MAGIMAFEVDFLPVGEGKKNGDAIAVRYGSPGAYKILVYDGGTQEAGKNLVAHVKKYYGTTYVDDVVNSHPDMDHASGLSVVLEELTIGTLWMHRPWNHSHLILNYFRDGRITNSSLKERLQNKMGAAYALEKLALSKGITIAEPFQGMKIGDFFVLSPDKDWYIHDLIADFEKSPEARAIKTTRLDTKVGIFAALTEAAVKAVEWISERWDQEFLREDIETSAENESSVVLYGYFEDQKAGVLLTGDAGILALRKSGEYLLTHNVDPSKHLRFIQIPHHGGRHNVSTSVLDLLLGPKLAAPLEKKVKFAFVSASPGAEYPRQMVANAFDKRGFGVIATKGRTVHWSLGISERDGWSAVESIPYSSKVEKW